MGGLAWRSLGASVVEAVMTWRREAQLAKKMPAWSELKNEYGSELSFKELG